MRETEGVKVALAQREREAHTLLGAHGEKSTAILVAKPVGHAVHGTMIARPRPARPPRPAERLAPLGPAPAQSLGRPSTRSPRILRRISEVPARMPLPRASNA